MTPCIEKPLIAVLATQPKQGQKDTAMKIFSYAFFVGLLLHVWYAEANAGGLHKCTDPGGNVTFSDTACPGTAAQSQQIDIPYSQPAPSNPNDYWSVENQAQRLKAEKAQAEQARAYRRSMQNHTNPQQHQMEQGVAEPEPILTYEQARRKALEANGYRNYGNLTASQKRSVDEEIAKYNHLPPPPRVQPQEAVRKPNSAGAINPYTGEFYAPAGDGYVGTRDGTFYAPAGPNGVIDTRTGEFIPVH